MFIHETAIIKAIIYMQPLFVQNVFYSHTNLNYPKLKKTNKHNAIKVKI